MRYLLALGFLFAIAIASPAQAVCQMPKDAGRAMRSESKQLYSLTYKGHSYTFWNYKGWDSANQVHSHEVILKDCKLAFSGAGGDEVSWSIGVPRPVAISFAKKEIENNIKRLGRAKIQARLLQHGSVGIQPELAEAYKALGFRLPSDIKIYPWDGPV
jgi:hypothetical protein